MFGDPNKPAPEYYVFIDEAGDTGTRAIKPVDANGATEWFVLGAVVVAAAKEREAVEWVREIKESVQQTQRPDLHYRYLGQSRRERACRILATKDQRSFVVASHKLNMRGYTNAKAQARGSQEYFYNWCVRVLLERVTAWCRAHSMKNFGEVRRAQLVFSSRGGLRYSQLVAYHEYLRRQSASNRLYLKRGDIAWDVLHPDLYKSIPHHQSAGAQLADVVASAFYQAVEARSAAWDCAPAIALGPRIARRGAAIAGTGVTLLPLSPAVPKLTAEQATIFNHYGYSL